MIMNAEALTALDVSIKKWDGISRAGDKDTPLGTDDCPLCRLFHRNWCDKCPVKEATGWGGCRTTPYDTAADARDRIPSRNSPIGWFLYSRRVRSFRAAAADEALFLRSLRPIGGVE